MINDHNDVFDDHAQVDRDDEEEQREEREEREMILTTVQLRRASVMDTLVPQVTIQDQGQYLKGCFLLKGPLDHCNSRQYDWNL